MQVRYKAIKLFMIEPEFNQNHPGSERIRTWRESAV
jgi:hypothetical protein